MYGISPVYTVAQNFHEQLFMMKKVCVTEPDSSSHEFHTAVVQCGGKKYTFAIEVSSL
jgi:hypothetical protein